jgi:hypothetical protein
VHAGSGKTSTTPRIGKSERHHHDLVLLLLPVHPDGNWFGSTGRRWGKGAGRGAKHWIPIFRLFFSVYVTEDSPSIVDVREREKDLFLHFTVRP